jgi:hypothetical protein
MNRCLLLSILLILASCAAKKQAAEFEAQPLWMKHKPVEPGYYTGVGSAKKVGTSHEYKEAAKRDALADLAEEISLKISSTSVLHTIETESGISETFISQATYSEKKELKKQKALEAAKVKYLAGKKEEEQHHAREAITFYLQGLQAIYNYLGEETQKEINGVTIDVGNELYSSLNEVVSFLKIEAVMNQVSVKRGKSLEQSLRFKTLYKSRQENGLPVNFKYSGGYLKKDRDFSNENGIVELQPGIINSKKSQEQITATINLEEIAQKAVDNLFIRGLLSKHTIEPAVVVVNIASPNLLLSIAEHYCHNNPCEKIHKIFNEIALAEGYNISTENEAEYIFTVKFTFKKGESAGGLYAAYLNGELTLMNENHKQIWTKSVAKIKGVGRSSDAAREKAFDEFVSDLSRLYFRQAFDQIK